MENMLIKIETLENGVQAVSARTLYEFLESKERFSKWFNRILDYDFIDGEDYAPYQTVHPQNGQQMTDYVMSLDMAKEAAMVSRLPKGKEARQYFIECERQLQMMQQDSYMIADPVQRAQRWIQEEQERQRLAVAAAALEEAQPFIDFADMILAADDEMDMQTVAGVIAQKGYGRTNLFRLLRAEQVLISTTQPYQTQVDAGRFKVKETPFTNTRTGKTRISRKVVVTQKGLQYIQQLVNADIRRKNEEVA